MTFGPAEADRFASHHDRGRKDREVAAMMWWNGSWAWMWIAMVPMMLLIWALIAAVVVPWARDGRYRAPSARELLDRRLAAGEISVEEHRNRRSELGHRS